MGDGNLGTNGVTSFGPFHLFVAERQLKKGDEPIDLGGRTLDTLIALVESAGEVVTQRELISRVWPDAVVEDANLRVQIAVLRKALGDRREDTRYIVTVPGRGYCFVAPVTRQSALESTTVVDQPQKLPLKLTRLIGRDDIIHALTTQLMMHRLVSVVGAGGIGKTTVAISVAHTLLKGFNGAVFFVDLAALTDAALVPTAIARALGLIVQTHDSMRGLPAFIGEKKLLLVLDNCEHVIQSAAAIAERIVGETPHAHVLTTSREALRVEGEHVHLLYALECPPEETALTAAEALKYPAAQLFMERAAASGYGGSLSDSDAPIAAMICRRLDGIPLAIELAASRAGSHGIHGVAQLLGNRFGLIWHGRRTALPRHQTLNAMLDWSYELLSQDEKTVFGRLSVFVGEFSLEAAQAVTSGEKMDDGIAIDAIGSLMAKSLISTTTARGSIYYRLLETTRTFAQAKLAERGEADRIARSRHAIFFSRFLQKDQLLKSSFDERDLFKYAVHIGNVRAALQWAFSDEGDAGVGVELATVAAPLFIRLSLLEECARWCEEALANAPDGTRGTRQEMILQEALALSSMYIAGNSDRVRRAIERALALEETFGNSRHHVELSFGLYRLFMRLADFRGALAVAQKNATFAEAANDPGGLLISDFMLGTCYHFTGDQAAAQVYCERAIARAAEPSTPIPNFFGFDHRVYAPISLARALWLRGFADQARSIAKTAIDESLSGARQLSICVSLTYGSPIFLWSGDLRAVDDYAERLIKYAAQYSLEPYRAAGLGLKGATAIVRNELDAGIASLRSALETLTTLKLNLLLTDFMGALAEGLCKRGQLNEALLTIDQAIARATDCGSTYDMAELLRIKAHIFTVAPQYGADLAIDCFTEALAVAKGQSALALELRSAIDLARLLARGGQHDQSQNELARIYDRFTEGYETVDLRAARELMQELA